MPRVRLIPQEVNHCSSEYLRVFDMVHMPAREDSELRILDLERKRFNLIDIDDAVFPGAENQRGRCDAADTPVG